MTTKKASVARRDCQAASNWQASDTFYLHHIREISYISYIFREQNHVFF
jgi:hypothetical protein